MKPTLRYYQHMLFHEIFNGWQDPQVMNILAVAPTGAGKTKTMGAVAEHFERGVAIAHRQELVGQISMALAEQGIVHRLICSDSVRREIQKEHVRVTGRRWVDANAKWAVAGVDTLVRMKVEPWMENVELVMMDEAHHVLRKNKWGKAWAMFPNARGLGVTATPERTDGAGLGRAFAGVFDKLVFSIPMRQLIDEGYLTDYSYIGDAKAMGDFDNYMKSHDGLSDTTGDYKTAQLSEYFKDNPGITGDVVETYLRHAAGKLGVTFAVDIDHAGKIAEEFRRRGVPAEVLSGKTPDALRRSLLKRFAARDFLQLVSVDILGEGFDLPAIEVVVFARPTQSYCLFVQQWGRVLRLMVDPQYMSQWETLTPEQRLWCISTSTKPRAIIIDHVGNLYRHMGPPDKPHAWSLAGRDKRGSGAIPERMCLAKDCLKSYEAWRSKCPFCGESAPEPAERGTPKMVAGEVRLYDDAVLAKLRGEAMKIERQLFMPHDLPLHLKARALEHHHDKVREQTTLRKTIDNWAMRLGALTQQEKERLFFYTFNIDVLSAMTLNARESSELNARIFTYLSQ